MARPFITISGIVPFQLIVEVGPLNIALDRSKTNKHMWQSDFAKDTAKHGYVLHSAMNWSNQHFTRATAVTLSNKITQIVTNTNRTRCSGFPLIFYNNLGFDPKKIIGCLPNEVCSLEDWTIRRAIYVNKYKTRVLRHL